jgi:hypothetical protein
MHVPYPALKLGSCEVLRLCTVPYPARKLGSCEVLRLCTVQCPAHKLGSCEVLMFCALPSSQARIIQSTALVYWLPFQSKSSDGASRPVSPGVWEELVVDSLLEEAVLGVKPLLHQQFHEVLKQATTVHTRFHLQPTQET